MSDFFHSFWSPYIAIASIISVLACLVLLAVTARGKANTTDSTQQTMTTGHVWDDDIQEMNNPLPLWWVGLFIITIVFGLAYLWLYPGLGESRGTLHWTSLQEYNDETAQASAKTKPLYDKFASQDIVLLARNPEARAIGERLFLNNCAQCHGSDAQGSKGFPNLTDKDWLHGGTPQAIKTSITNGRIGMMPPMAQAVGSAEDIRNVAHYVLKLSGSPHDSIRAGLGKSKFVACVACHGVGGVGNSAIGAPNLSDNTWLHGYGEDLIVSMINNGKTNQMPAQEGRLSAEQIHLLTAYVWGLGGGQEQR